ncbi:hypothetical protein EVAR_21318_1 [Eumeta japonica]|uniref:Uncharacterized protein n=1 Tax=Eumeta variegata TaxID=151549 RepID=A0A4C1ZPR3_EUMVA|nr:hypothetical protein EVAR_21318_1 [Eumeta japonica]
MVSKVNDSGKKKGVKVNVSNFKVMVFETSESMAECDMSIGDCNNMAPLTHIDGLGKKQQEINRLVQETLEKSIPFEVVLKQNEMLDEKSSLDRSVSLMLEMLNLLKQMHKDLVMHPSLLEKIKKFIEIKETKGWNTCLDSLFNVNKSWRKLMFEESLILGCKVDACLNALKHDPTLLTRHLVEVQKLQRNDKLHLDRVIAKIRVYWPESLALDWTTAYRTELKQPPPSKAVVRGLCLLLPPSELQLLLEEYAPTTPKIQWKEIDDTLLGLQKYLGQNCNNMAPLTHIDGLGKKQQEINRLVQETLEKSIPFEVVLKQNELTKIMKSESSPRERAAILKVLLSCAQYESHDIHKLLQYFHDKHINEPFTFKIEFVNNLLSMTDTYRFKEETWKLLDELFYSLEVYSESDKNVDECTKAIIVYKVLHKQPVPEYLYNLIENKLNAEMLDENQVWIEVSSNRKIRVYWPESLALDWTTAYRTELKQPPPSKAVVRGLCLLLPPSELQLLLEEYAPTTPKIQWKEIDDTLLGLQKYLGQSMYIARPALQPNLLLQYAVGDYLPFTLPSLISVFYNLSENDSRNILKQTLISSMSISLQKHGMRIAFSKLDSNELKEMFLNVWTISKNMTIRAVAFELTYKLLCKEKNVQRVNEIWQLLEMFMDKLSPEENQKYTH